MKDSTSSGFYAGSAGSQCNKALLTYYSSYPVVMSPEELLDLLQGSIPPFAKETGHVTCDICFAPITPPTTVGVYATNIDVEEEARRPLRANVMFCEDCNPEQIRQPKFGVVEIQLTVDLVDEGGLPRMESPRVNQTSKTHDGMNWNPKTVWEEIANIPVPDMGESAATPAHVSEILYQAGVDVRDRLREDGSLTFEGTSREDERQKVEEYITTAVGGRGTTSR